jgi:hypothetical protein
LELLSVFAENPLDLRDVRGLRQRQLQPPQASTPRPGRK